MDLFVQLVPKAETLVYHLLRNACLEIKQDIGHITEYKLVWVMTCENTFFQMVPRIKKIKNLKPSGTTTTTTGSFNNCEYVGRPQWSERASLQLHGKSLFSV